MATVKQEWIYKNDKQNSIRYVLGTKGVKPLICFGVNPSTAEPGSLDNTLRSVERLSIHNGFDSWIMLNIYPQRATNPNEIHHDINVSIHKKNLKFINCFLSEIQNPTIWAAWGTLIEKRSFLPRCLEEIYALTTKHNCNWVSLGNPSKKGHPHHPLYINSTTKHKPFDVHNYIKNTLTKH